MDVRRRTVLKSAAAVSIASTACGARLAQAQASPFNLKVASNVQTNHPIYIRLAEASDRIKADSQGKVNISIFPNGQLGSDTDMLSQVRSGGIDLLTMPGVVLANLVPLASLNSVGFIFADYPAVWKAMDGAFGAYIRAGIQKANLVVFDKVWDNGFRHISSLKTIRSAGDVNGLKIRVPVSPLLLSLFKSLGAAPTPINFNELYSALQTRVVEAQENALPLFATAKLYEVQKCMALTAHTWDGYWMLANKRSFEALPADLRDLVTRHLNSAAVAQRADSEKQAVSLQQELSAKGMAINSPDNASFRNVLQKNGFYTEWQKKFGDEAWAQIESVAGKLV